MNKNVKAFQKDLNQVARDLDKAPSQVTITEFKANTDYTEWELRKIGGFAALVTLLYPESRVPGTGALSTKSKGNFLKKKITKQVNDEYLKLEFLDAFKEEIRTQGIKVHPQSKIPKGKVGNKSRTTVVHISDTHFGANIEASEMHNVNEFNWTVASRRMALLAEQTVGYKPQYRADTELVIVINGDIIAGVIHNQEWFADLLARQTAGTLKILIQFISYTAKSFGKVRVVMTSGNHGRAMHKGSKDRGTTHKWDSYETMIYLGVKHAVEAKCPNVKCEIPETPYAIVDIQGHNFFITHGDTVINAGNPGSSLNMKSLNTQIMKLISSFKMPFAGVMLGHTHVSTVQTLDSSTKLLVNGTLSGADPYCQSIGIFSNNPEQTLFEVTKDHAVGDIRFIELTAADDRKELDKIIEPLKGNLE
jgi:predicted phosphodiesterase